MPAVSTYDVKLDMKAIRNEAVSPEMGAEMVAAAKRAIPFFESIAPVRTGKYKNRIVTRRRIESVSGMRRQVAYLADMAWEMQGGKKRYYGWAVEWGKGAHHTLKKTIEEMRTMQ